MCTRSNQASGDPEHLREVGWLLACLREYDRIIAIQPSNCACRPATSVTRRTRLPIERTHASMEKPPNCSLLKHHGEPFVQCLHENNAAS